MSSEQVSSKQLDPVSCETQGHLWGDSACIMCKTPKPKYAPSLEFAMRQVERCRNYAPTDRVENEDTIVTLGDEIERLQEDLRLARIESAHFANTQRATQAELEMARVSSSELERYKRALYQANGQLMQLDKEPVKLDYSADEPSDVSPAVCLGLAKLGSILNGHGAHITPMDAQALLTRWVQLEASARATVPPSPDVELVDFLQRWVWHAKERGFQWDSFTFDTKRPVREQLREQMQAGMNELQKGSTVTKTVDPHAACTGCGISRPRCEREWKHQRKCCPDCSHCSAVGEGVARE
jgi:hypothetical protein